MPLGLGSGPGYTPRIWPETMKLSARSTRGSHKGWARGGFPVGTITRGQLKPLNHTLLVIPSLIPTRHFLKLCAFILKLRRCELWPVHTRLETRVSRGLGAGKAVPVGLGGGSGKWERPPPTPYPHHAPPHQWLLRHKAKPKAKRKGARTDISSQQPHHEHDALHPPRSWALPLGSPRNS